MRHETLAAIFGVIFVVVLVVLGFWLWLEGPCWLWTLSPAGEAPIRCVR